MQELNLPLLENIGEYNNNQLNLIEELVLKKHYEYGYGIVMTNDIHRLFHKIYGNRNNTYKQVLEFKDYYKKGKYAEKI